MPLIPQSPHGPFLVDPAGIPRFWATVWSMFELNGLAESSHRERLSHLEALYRHSEQMAATQSLDDILAAADIGAIETLLESFFLALRNVTTPTQFATRRWLAAFKFVSITLERICRSSSNAPVLDGLTVRLARLDRLYGQLRPIKQRRASQIRSLPSPVVTTLYDVVSPESEANPFKDEKTKWRIWTCFILLLHLGLRRGELLCLAVDALKEERNASGHKFWLNIDFNKYELDPRFSKPSIKTAQSIRQLPVSSTTATLIRHYIDNYRGRPNHSFLINSFRNTPMSLEGMSKAFQKISTALPEQSKIALVDRMHTPTVSAHDLRHTCVVSRLSQLLSNGIEMNQALQIIRVFFGWTETSDMPQKYARAAFESRLATVWNDAFDDRVSFVRSLSGTHS